MPVAGAVQEHQEHVEEGWCKGLSRLEPVERYSGGKVYRYAGVVAAGGCTSVEPVDWSASEPVNRCTGRAAQRQCVSA